MKYDSAARKTEILPFATTWMELEGIGLSETSERENDDHSMTSLTCRI